MLLLAPLTRKAIEIPARQLSRSCTEFAKAFVLFRSALIAAQRHRMDPVQELDSGLPGILSDIIPAREVINLWTSQKRERSNSSVGTVVKAAA